MIPRPQDIQDATNNTEILISTWIRENFNGLGCFKVYSHWRNPSIFVYLELARRYGYGSIDDRSELTIGDPRVSILSILFYDCETSSFEVSLRQNPLSHIVHLADPNFFEKISAYIIRDIQYVLNIRNIGYSVADDLPLRIV